MKYFESFAGVGGFSLGIERAYGMDVSAPTWSKQRRVDMEGSCTLNNNKSVATQQPPTCVGFSEIDKYASAVLKYNYPNIKNYGDITKIDWSTVPDFDLLTGGSPCQDFSVAGKRAGLDGERSGLFNEYLRALQEKQPKYFIWENVKGVLSSRSGWDFGNIQVAFSEAGYSLWWQVLNAKDFGVPQNRERIFVVGTRNGSPREILFERRSDEQHNGSDGQGNAYCLQAGGDKHRGTYIKQLNNPTHSNNRVYGDEGLSLALNTMQGGNRQPFIATNNKKAYNEVYAKQDTKQSKEEMPTVQEVTQAEMVSKESKVGVSHSLQEKNVLQLGVSQRGNAPSVAEGRSGSSRELQGNADISEAGSLRDLQGGEANGDTPQERNKDRQQSEESSRDLSRLPHQTTSDGSEKERLEETEAKQKGSFRIRRLTERECEALMSWPKNWTQHGNFNGEVKEISNSQRYKMCGNGVVSEVVKHVVKELILTPR